MTAQSDDTELFVKHYTDVIALIKEKNSDCRIYLCSSCPRGDTDVSSFNNGIEEIATNHAVRFIDIYPSYLRSKFYGKKDWIHLSNSGTKRLLGTIDRVIPIVSSFDTCVFASEVHEKRDKRRTQHDFKQPHQRPKQSYRNWSTGLKSNSTQPLSNTEQRDHQYSNKNKYHYDNERGNHPDNYYTDQHWNGYSETDHYDSGYSHEQGYSDEHYYSSPLERCSKCRLTNHSLPNAGIGSSFFVLSASYMDIKTQCVGIYRALANTRYARIFMSGSHYQIDTQNSYDSLFNLCQTCNSIDCSCDSVLDINSIDTASTGNRETEIHILQCDADCPSTASHSAKSSDFDNNDENDTIDNESTDYLYSSAIYDDVQHDNNYLYNNTCTTLSMNSSNSVNVSTSMSA